MRQTGNPASRLILVALLMVISSSCGKTIKEVAVKSDLAEKLLRFAPATVTANTSSLSPGDRQALLLLIDAGKIMDTIYLRQVWSGNPALLDRLDKDNTPAGLERLHFFKINFGPWSELDGDAPFIEGVPATKPKGANFYPEDMSQEEFVAWVKTLSPADQEKAQGFFWVIRRDSSRKLTLIPYSQEYRDELEKAAALLRQAASLTENSSLKKYLTLRAAAFLNDDYYPSDVAWMELDAPLDVTIGPYETYTDELFGYKAAFEGFITLRDDAETQALAHYSSYLQDMENHLPLDNKYKNPKLGALAPIRVVNEVFVGGDAKAGVQAAAFNLPNDPKVVKEKGSKRVMLKNVQEAKFQSILTPIAKILVDQAQLPEVAFRPFFTHIVAHELMHGLGPQSAQVDGRESSLRLALKDLYSPLEEAKADITGLWAVQYMIDHGKLEKEMERPLYVTFLASAFRSVRFGINEAHGKGVALQFNFLTDEGAFERDPASGAFRVSFEKVKPAVVKLTHEILTIEAEGDYLKAKETLGKYGVIRPEMQQALDRLKGIPVDIEPVFPFALRKE